MTEEAAVKPPMGVRYVDDWKYDVNWDPIDDKPLDDLVDEELERARASDRNEARGRYMAGEMDAIDTFSQLRRNRDGGRPARAVSAPVADHGRKRLGGLNKANVTAAPRDVAVMSNSVHSIGRREKSSIRRPEPTPPVAQSLNAMRLLLEMLFHVRAKTDSEFKELSLSIPDLSRACGLSYRMSRGQAEM